MFTTPCFIRKNTPELREQLLYLRYSPCLFSEDDGCLVTEANIFTSINAEDFDNKELIPTWNKPGRIDCGDNEELFLALVALRDDSMFMQLFVYEKDTMFNKKGNIFYCYHDGNKVMEELIANGIIKRLTPTEIIAHFKQKE